LKVEQIPSVTANIKKRRKESRLIIIISVFVFVLIIAPMAFTILVYNFGVVKRVESPSLSQWFRYEDVDGYERRLTSFYSGRNKLQAYIYGETNDKGLIVISHGLDWGAENYFTETMFFVDNGWRVFTFDNTGTHNSEGRNTRGLPQAVLDLDAALTYIANQNWKLPIMLYGHSWGGYAVTAVLGKWHNINAVASLAGFNTPMRVMHETARDYLGLGIITAICYPHHWTYHNIRFGQHAGLSAVDGINNSGAPVLIIHGTDDHLISYGSASIIAQKDKINNPNVEYVSHSLPHHNGHSNLWRNVETAGNIIKFNAALDDLRDNYNGKIPYDVLADFYVANRSHINVLDIEFMDKINDFFEGYLVRETEPSSDL